MYIELAYIYIYIYIYIYRWIRCICIYREILHANNYRIYKSRVELVII